MAVDRFGKKIKSPSFTGFEAGACVVTELRPRSAVSPEPSTNDPVAALEAARLRLFADLDGRIDALKTRAADLESQAKVKRGEVHHIGATHAADAATMNRISVLQIEAYNQSSEARRLINIDLPKLDHERTLICSGTHPDMFALRVAADNQAAAELRARVPEKLPSFVVLQTNFGWCEGHQTLTFREGQIVRDRELIGKLIARHASLELGV